MPAPPEIRYRSCPIRRIEICRQIKAQHLRNSDCHVRISGKIKINLKRIGKHDNQTVYVRAVREQRIVLCHRRSKRIGQNDLLEQAAGKHLNAGSHFLVIQGKSVVLPKLRKKITHRGNRSL